MKKFYFIIPVVLLGIFIFFYLNARNGINAAEQARIEKEAKVQEERRKKEIADRQRAYDEAAAQANARIAEINAKAELKAKQEAARADATDARDLAFRERDRLNKQVGKLTDDLVLAKEQKAKAEEDLKIQKTQVDYLKTSTAEVAKNKTLYENVIQKLTDAEQAYARAQAAAAAAAAAAKNPQRSN